VLDKPKVIQHIGMMIAAGDLSLVGLVDINQTAINAMAKLQKEHMDVPGILSRPFSTMSMRKA